MADRMFRVTTMGVLDLLRVEVDMFDLADGRTIHIAGTEVYVAHEQDEDFLNDLRAIGRALLHIADAG